jgi:hypothetical protein
VTNTFRRTLTVLAAGTAVAGSLAAVSAVPAYANCDLPRLVSVGDARAYEGTNASGTMLTFVVSTGGATCNASSVHFTTAGGPVPSGYGLATAGVDYTPISGTLTWAAGDSSDRTITVKVAADIMDEKNERFHVKLSNPTGFTSVNPNDGLGDILDDDGPVTWNIDDATCVEGVPPGKTLCNVKITTSRASAADMTVKLTTADGSATSPSDYVAVAKTVTVKAFTRTATSQIAVVNDAVCEGPETFDAQLTSPSAGAVADGESVLMIDETIFLCLP